MITKRILNLAPRAAWVAGILVFSIQSAVLHAGDWPQFRGPGGLGVSADQGVAIHWGPTQNIVWKTALPGKGTSSPIVVGSRVIVTCHGGALDQVSRQILCFDRANGELLWSTDVPSKLPEGRISRGDHGYASSTPAADGQCIYAFFGKSGVFAFDFHGRQLWHADVGEQLHEWGSAASPVLFRDLVIINDSTGIAHCVNAQTGELVYAERIPRADEVYSAAVLAEDRLYYLSRSGRTFVLAAKPNFEVLATNDLETGSLFNSSPAVAGGRLYLRSDQHLYCIGTP